MNLVLVAPTVAIVLHIIEEFVFPGGFLSWHRNYRPQHTRSISPKFAIIINALLLLFSGQVVFLGPTPEGVAVWLVVAAILFSNALFHIRGAVATKSYSPGLITSIILYLPLAVAGYYYFLHAGLASIGTAVVALIMGGSYPLVSVLLHKWRSKNNEEQEPHT